MKKIISLILVLSLVLILAACGTSEDSVNGTAPEQNTASENEQTQNEENEEVEENASTTGIALPVIVNGEKQYPDATFETSEQLGYGLYVLTTYSLETGEENKDLLVSTEDASNLAEIQELAADVDLEAEKATIAETLTGLGEVTEEDPTTLEVDTFHGATSFYSAEGEDGTVTQYMIIGLGDSNYKIKLQYASKDQLEKVQNELLAMLKTIQ